MSKDWAVASKLDKFIRSNRGKLVDQVWAAITAQASLFTSMITGGAVSDVIKPDTGGLFYEEGGIVRPVDAASGCQKAVIGVSLRAAISSLYSSGADFIMLDEITADMDEVHSASTMEVISRMSKQVICITHRSADVKDSYNIIEM